MSVFKRVAELFTRFPGMSQGTVASIVHVTGDVIAQKVFEKKENLDLTRSFRFAVLGFCSGYVQMKWYGCLYLPLKYQVVCSSILTVAWETAVELMRTGDTSVAFANVDYTEAGTFSVSEYPTLGEVSQKYIGPREADEIAENKSAGETLSDIKFVLEVLYGGGMKLKIETDIPDDTKQVLVTLDENHQHMWAVPQDF